MLSYLFLVAIVASASRIEESKGNIDPFALEDEIRAELEELKSLISGHIFAALDDIDYATYQAYIYRDNRRKGAEISISQQYNMLEYDLSQLNDLASAAGANIEQCLEIQQTIGQLLNQVVASFPECLNPYTNEVDLIRDSTAYKIDTTINEVHAFDFELERCAGNILCLAPVANEMSLARVSIPQNIGVELIKAQELFDDRKIPVADCMDGKITLFATEATTIFNIITRCIDEAM